MITIPFQHYESGDFLQQVINDLSIRLSPRFVFYKPHYQVYSESSRYILRTAHSIKELQQVFRLRYKNFLESDGESTEYLDTDGFDHQCDHLIILCKESRKIVGTYRMLCSHFTDDFYSQGEFHISDFLSQPGIKLELGRACIDRAHRNGHVIDLLWRGIGEYVQLSGARYLFGCSSVGVTDRKTASDLFQYFVDHDNVDQTFNIEVTEKYEMPLIEESQYQKLEVKKMIPPLLRSYFNAGAKIMARPALDVEFRCIDFFTVLDMENLNPSFHKRYFKQEISHEAS